ncbi:MAG: helix-hairpin-helix domain-containing protein [Lachnospiraceae bacterium]|nr:helix-hairpin-helix domain-containing protein [Lachnospiraceae bacterium]
MKKEIKIVLPAAIALLSAFVLAACGNSGETTLSQLEAANADDAFFETDSETEANLLSTNAQDEAAGIPQPDTVIVVYICGSVQNPGVYELPAGSRVCDGLDAAGGFSEGADEKRINLAGILSDGDMVFFPEEGESIPEGASDYVTGSAGNESVTSLININTAGEQALCTLPGIGSSKAQAIIKYREEHGSFKDIKEIMNVNGIGESLYSQIKDLICV